MGIAERLIESCRREFLDHIIALNERRLVRLLRDYINYYHLDKVHDSLGHDMPKSRPVERTPKANATVISLPRLGGGTPLRRGRGRISAPRRVNAWNDE